MPARQPSRIAYAGREALLEQPLPNPSDIEIELEMVKRENAELRIQLRHIEQALGAAARLLTPYNNRLNGR
jgi:hypothetical protein